MEKASDAGRKGGGVVGNAGGHGVKGNVGGRGVEGNAGNTRGEGVAGNAGNTRTPEAEHRCARKRDNSVGYAPRGYAAESCRGRPRRGTIFSVKIYGACRG